MKKPQLLTPKLNVKDKNITKNSILSVVYKIVGMFVSLISSPLMLNCLGEEKYGVWASLLSLVSWVYYFDFGIGNGLRNKLAVSIAQEDENSSKKFICVSYVVVGIMSVAIFIIVAILLQIINLDDIFGLHLDDENINIVVLFAVFFASLNFVAALVNNVLYALQRASAVSFFNIVGQVIFVLAMVIYLVTGQQLLLAVAIAEGISQLLKNVIETVYVYGKNKNLRFKLRDFDFSYSKGITSFGLQMFVVQMAALVLNTTDNLIITKYFGAAEVTPYNFCYKYFNMINGVFVALMTPILSAYTAAYARREFPWIEKTLRKSWILYFIFILGTAVAGFIFKPFAKIWLHKELDYQQGLIFFTGLYFGLLMCSHVTSTFITGIGEIKETTIATVVQAIVNIPVSIVLATTCGMGVNGVILGSVISVSIGTIVGLVKSKSILYKLRREK